MACQVVAKGDSKYDSVVVNGYYEMSVLEFIAERVNSYRKRAWTCAPGDKKPIFYRLRAPARPEPDLNRKV